MTVWTWWTVWSSWTKFTIRSLGIRVVIAALLAWVAAPCGAMTYHSRPPYPTGNLVFAQPQIRWMVWPDAPSRVAGVRMTLNGKPVPAKYLPGELSAVYVPDAPLPAGEYAVHCSVTMTGAGPVAQDWKFAITKSALSRLPALGTEAPVALATANWFRKAMGLPDLRLNVSLCAAAAAHSRYLNTNHEFGHTELAGRRDFVGRDLMERNGAFGYWGGGYEDVSFSSGSAASAVAGLFDAPYHRIPFMQPGAGEFGMGRSGRQTTLEFGLTRDEGVSVYPAPNQTAVPRSWVDTESPDPLAIHGKKPGRTGYVIAYAFFGKGNAAISVASAALTDAAGHPVACFLNTPANDSHLKNAVLIIPQAPLKPNTVYTAEVKASTAVGRNISRRWMFTTGK